MSYLLVYKDFVEDEIALVCQDTLKFMSLYIKTLAPEAGIWGRDK